MFSEISQASFAIFFVTLLSMISSAQAFGAGDAIALVLGLIIFFVGLCIFLGWYSRRGH